MSSKPIQKETRCWTKSPFIVEFCDGKYVRCLVWKTRGEADWSLSSYCKFVIQMTTSRPEEKRRTSHKYLPCSKFQGSLLCVFVVCSLGVEVGFPAWNGWNSSSGRRLGKPGVIDGRTQGPRGSATIRQSYRPFQPTKQTKMKDDALPGKMGRALMKTEHSGYGQTSAGCSPGGGRSVSRTLPPRLV